ncbi:MAG: hypothetical protein U5R31_09145 [Acidimicrobiia bacterium]|nr:hypothetical protein [Acidimicrobiia bacterium]
MAARLRKHLIFVELPLRRRQLRPVRPRPSSAGRSNPDPLASSTESSRARTSSSPTAPRVPRATCTWASTTSPTHGPTPTPRASNRAISPATVGRPGYWILVSEDDSQERILAEAEKRGAEILWRKHYWAEFNGFNSALIDPWGNTLMLWTKGGDNPQIPEGFTNE